MTKKYDIWFRDPCALLWNQLVNKDFDGEINYAPRQVFNVLDKRVWSDFMTGYWAWDQAVCIPFVKFPAVGAYSRQNTIAQDPMTHGATFVPIILGSDKTTVSVATGQNKYYPLYISNGCVHNGARRAHRNAVSLVGFLAIPKGQSGPNFSHFPYSQISVVADREFSNSEEFWSFRRDLFHASLTAIVEPLRAGMTTPEVTLFPDGHFRCVVYGIGPYIADYPEQVQLAGIVQGWCPRYVSSSLL
jgi:Plavaka transposase